MANLIKDQTPSIGSKERYNSLAELTLIADKMTRIGWRIDRDRLESHRMGSKARAAEYTDKFVALSGLDREALGKAGTGSTKQVYEWFFKEQEAPVVTVDKHTRRAQLNSATLVEWATTYAKKPFGPAAAALYALRKNKKIGQYTEAYRILSAVDGRIHASFFPWGTKTGRWTSGARVIIEGKKYGMNMQQVPSKEPTFDFGNGPVKLIESLRDVFIADPGCIIGSADYEALELRLIAYVHGAKLLLKWIADGTDPHAENAKGLFREAYERDQKKARNAAKPVMYGVAYSMHSDTGENGYKQLYKQLKDVFPSITEKQTKLLADRLFELHPEIKAGQTSIKESVELLGYAELAINGRRLYYPNSIRGVNQALNFVMQGSGAELINRAIRKINSQCRYEEGKFYIVGQVHDELVFNVPNGFESEAKKIVEEAMGTPAMLGKTTAGIPAKLKFGENWAKAH